MCSFHYIESSVASISDCILSSLNCFTSNIIPVLNFTFIQHENVWFNSFNLSLCGGIASLWYRRLQRSRSSHRPMGIVVIGKIPESMTDHFQKMSKVESIIIFSGNIDISPYGTVVKARFQNQWRTNFKRWQQMSTHVFKHKQDLYKTI